MTRYILENTKTGAFVVYASEAQAKRAAAHMGWMDSTITPTESVLTPTPNPCHATRARPLWIDPPRPKQCLTSLGRASNPR